VSVQPPQVRLTRVHRAGARSSLNPAVWDIWVRLEWQLDDLQTLTREDRVSLLPNVAERAYEVVPVEHGPRVTHTKLLIVRGHLFYL